jgi:tetratricopeptide (TPR) repeat protein
LAVFAAHGDRLDQRFGHQRRLEEAAILRQLDRRPEAIQRIAAVTADANAPSMASLQAGQELFELGDFPAAEAALARAVPELPIANYWLARLKLQQNDVDSCLGLLGRAAKAQPAEVRRLLDNEPAAWSAVAADARFQELQRPPAAAPTR